MNLGLLRLTLQGWWNGQEVGQLDELPAGRSRQGT